MAQFTAQLTDPDTRAFDSGISAPRQGGGNELASLISGGMQVLDTHLKRKEYDANVAKAAAQEAAEVAAKNASESGKASITKEVIGIQMEANQQQLDAGDIEQEMYALNQNYNSLGPAQRERLEQLRMKARRLDLLPKGQGRTRILAAHKQAVEEWAGVVDVDEINSIFGVAKSDLDKVYEAPKNPPEVEEFLQKTYGTNPTGAYTPEQRSTAFRHHFTKKRMEEDAQLDMGNAVAAAYGYSLTSAQPVLADMARTAATQNGVLNDDQVASFQQQLTLLRNENIAKIERLGAGYSKNRIDVSKEKLEALKQTNAGYDYLDSLLVGTGSFGDNVRSLKRLQTTNQVITELQKQGMIKYQPFLDMLKVFGGEQGARAVLQSDPTALRAFFGKGTDVNEIKMMGAKAMQAALTVDGVQQAVEIGAISQQDATFWAANTILPNATTPEQTVNGLQAMTMATLADNFVPHVEAMLAPKTIAATKEQAKNSVDVRNQMSTAAITMLDTLGEGIPDKYHNNISIDRVGNLSLQVSESPASRSEVAMWQKKFDIYNKWASIYSNEIGGQAKQAQEFYKSLKPEEQPKE